MTNISSLFYLTLHTFIKDNTSVIVDIYNYNSFDEIIEILYNTLIIC